MKNSIKKAVWLRVAVIFFALVISGVSTIGGLTAINRYNASTTQATDLYIMALDAEKAHFSWVENLSSAINFDTELDVYKRQDVADVSASDASEAHPTRSSNAAKAAAEIILQFIGRFPPF